LAGLKNLHHLNLRKTRVTDAGLRELGGLEQLKTLTIWETQVTEEGIKRLECTLPRLEIIDRNTSPIPFRIP
jgi:hypothetical protein